MNILEMIEILLPAISSFLGITVMVLAGIYKITNVITTFKNDKDKLVKEINSINDSYKTAIDSLVKENRELAKINALLIDNLNHVKGYTQSKLGG